jgi:hypothetical protein
MGSSCFLNYHDSTEGFQVLRQEEAWSDKLGPGGKRMPISQSGMIQTEDWQARLLIAVAWPIIVILETCSIVMEGRELFFMRICGIFKLSLSGVILHLGPSEFPK